MKYEILLKKSVLNRIVKNLSALTDKKPEKYRTDCIAIDFSFCSDSCTMNFTATDSKKLAETQIPMDDESICALPDKPILVTAKDFLTAIKGLGCEPSSMVRLVAQYSHDNQVALYITTTGTPTEISIQEGDYPDIRSIRKKLIAGFKDKSIKFKLSDQWSKTIFDRLLKANVSHPRTEFLNEAIIRLRDYFSDYDITFGLVGIDEYKERDSLIQCFNHDDGSRIFVGFYDRLPEEDNLFDRQATYVLNNLRCGMNVFYKPNFGLIECEVDEDGFLFMTARDSDDESINHKVYIAPRW